MLVLAWFALITQLPAKPQNIVLFMADDWSWPHAGICRDRSVPTYPVAEPIRPLVTR